MYFEYQKHPKDVRKFSDIYVGDLFRLKKMIVLSALKFQIIQGYLFILIVFFEFTYEEIELLDYKIIIYSEE